MRSLTRVVFALALAAPALPAQPPVVPAWPVASGSRVRILSPVLGDKKQTGTVISATPDTLFFRQSRQSATRPLSTSEIAKIDVARGTHSRLMKGALIGFAIGAAGGAAIGAATYKPSTSLSPDFGRGGTAAFVAAFGGAAGAITGALVGTHRTDTWVPIDIPRRVTSLTADRPN